MPNPATTAVANTGTALLLTSEVEKEISTAIANANAIVKVENDSDARTAGVAITALKKITKMVNGDRLDLTRKIDAVKSSIMAQEKTILLPIGTAQARVEKILTAHLVAVEEKRRQEERDRRAEEERKAAAEAAQAEADAAFTNPEDAVPDPVVEPEVLPAVADTKKPQLVRGVGARSVWKVSITNANEVPREFCKPDEEAIKRWMQEQKQAGIDIENISMAGVKFFSELSIIG